LRGEAAMAESKQKTLDNALPKKDELFSFPNQIAKISAEKAVGTNFSFGREDVGQIGYNLTIQGSYASIFEFIKVIENDIPFMNISLFNLTLNDNEYGVNLNGNVFFNGEEG